MRASNFSVFISKSVPHKPVMDYKVSTILDKLSSGGLAGHGEEPGLAGPAELCLVMFLLSSK